jgi:hypothetical protein
MSKPKIYTIKRQFVTLRLDKSEWAYFQRLAKKVKVNQTMLATAIIGRHLAIQKASEDAKKNRI